MPGRAIPVAQLGVRSGRSSPAASTAPIAASGLFGARLHPRVVRFWEPARSLKAELLALSTTCSARLDSFLRGGGA